MIRRKWSFEFTISILIFLLVFAFTWQLKGVRKNSEIRDRQTLDRATLEKYYVDEVQKNEKLKIEIASQADIIEAFRNKAAQGDDYASVLNEKLSEAELYAGLTKVSGKGITVTLKDVELTKEMKESGLYNNYGIVHDVNIRTFINELKAAGAEAISVNGERIVAMSEVRCVGPTIMINGDRVAAPFVIKAIGNPKNLESALTINGGAVEEATKIYGISVTVEKKDKLTIEEFLGSTQMEYAKTVKEEEEKKK
ncbi:MAG: DUF881 domain-containing protein [Clostridia bacterium]|nr:DUF881 domain-containing protein [Clostridia bacterium]